MAELPIEKYRELITATVSRNRVTIVVGETGSGKTTRMPVYLHEAGLGTIGIAEPRRIAAISAAEFVAQTLGYGVGEEVGFQIRFNDTTSQGTRIKFMTDGILLQEAKSDPLFSLYSVLVFDEVHERGLNTDFALGLVKRALALRKDLKVVVMSATMEAKKFSAFFDGAPIINIEGRMYPVEVRHIKEEEKQAAYALFAEEEDWRRRENPEHKVAKLAAYAAKQIHARTVHGDILIFMPGEDSIRRTMGFIESLGLRGVTVLPVYGNMSPQDQRRIFQNVAGRKIVVATNVAETSITIDGVVYVIDSGLIKESDFDPASGVQTLHTVEHSKAGLEQRKGRAGRTQSGECLRLMTQEEYEQGRFDFRRLSGESKRPSYTTPEIQRSNLAGVVLRLVGIGVKDVESFELVDAPSADTVIHAFEELHAIGALNEHRDLTNVGERLLDIPLEPKLGRMILEAEKFGCVQEIVDIASTLSVRDFHTRPKDKEVEANIAKRKFRDPRSDLLSALAVLQAYENSGWNRTWAYENFLNWKAIEEALNIRLQIEEILVQIGIERTSVGYHFPEDPYELTEEEKVHGETIGKAVTAGFLRNLMKVGGRTRRGVPIYRRMSAAALFEEVFIHPGSMLFSANPDILVCSAIVETTKTYARNCHAVNPSWLAEIAPDRVRMEIGKPYRTYKGTYVVGRQTYFDGEVLSDEQEDLTGPAATALLARDMASQWGWGILSLPLPCVARNKETLRLAERIHRESEGATKPPLTNEQLEQWYIDRLGTAQNDEDVRELGDALLLDPRELFSQEDEERYVRPSMYTGISPWIPSIVLHSERIFAEDREIPPEIEERLQGMKNLVEEIARNPDLYGYGFEGRGWMRRRGSYALSDKMENVRRAFVRGETQEGEELLDKLSQELARAVEVKALRQKRRTKKLEKVLEKQDLAAEQECLEAEWAEYQKKLAHLRDQCGMYAGFGEYKFPIGNDGLPAPYQEKDGRTYVFDQDFFEILPEKEVPCWGYVTQWGTGKNPTKVALLMEVMEKPKNIS